MMLRAGLFLVLLGLAGPAQAECLAFCDGSTLGPEKALATFRADLGQDLPAGISLLGMLDGGFQDRFIQVKFQAADAAALQAFLALLAVPPDGFLAAEEGAQLTLAPAKFWHPEKEKALMLAMGSLPEFFQTTVAIAPDPDKAGATLIYLIAFQV